jgi:hypothetical protein
MAGKHHNARTSNRAPATISRQTTRDTQQQITSRARAATAVAQLRALGIDGEGRFNPNAASEAESIQLTHALSTLATYAPQLHKHPEILGEINEIFRRAAATAEALGTSLPGGMGALPSIPMAALGSSGNGGARSRLFGVPGLGGMDGMDAARVNALYRQLAASGDPAAQGLARDVEHGLANLAGGSVKTGNPTGAVPHTSTTGVWAGGSRADNTPKGVANADLLRSWANQVPWVRTAINIRREQIGRTTPAVEPLEPTGKFDRKTRDHLALLFEQPNEYRQNWSEFIGEVLEDILTLDRGVITKNMTVARKPQALYAQDGATIKIFAGWDGDSKTPRYLYQEPDSTRSVPLRNDECIVVMANPATYRFGLSPIQVLRQTIIADIKAMQAAAHVVDMKPPPHLIQFPGLNQTTLNTMRAQYEAELAGQREVWLVGGDEEVKVFPLVHSLKDNQVLDWQIYLARQICAVFQISPQQLGITMDINRATGEVQQEIFEDQGLMPLLLLIETYLNREIVADYAKQLEMGRADLSGLNLCVRFPEVTEAQRILHVERMIQLASKAMPQLPSMTPNEVRVAMGQEPMLGGDTLYTVGQPAIPWLSYDGEHGQSAGVDPSTQAADQRGDPSALGGSGTEEGGGDQGQGDDTPKDSGDGSSPTPTQTAETGSSAAPLDGGGAATGDGAGAGSSPTATTSHSAPTSKTSKTSPRPPRDLQPILSPQQIARTLAPGHRLPGRRWIPPTAGGEIGSVPDRYHRPSTGGAGKDPLPLQRAKSDAKSDKTSGAHSSRRHPHPLPTARVKPEVAASYSVNKRELEARMHLQAEAAAIFERAANRHRKG